MQRKTQSHWSYRMMIPLAHATAFVIWSLVIIPILCADLVRWLWRKKKI